MPVEYLTPLVIADEGRERKSGGAREKVRQYGKWLSRQTVDRFD